jgi:hypothetical protein
VLSRFHRDDVELVRGVLRDLVDSGLVLKIGSGASTAYRAATKDELASLERVQGNDGTDELLWAIIFREGPIAHDALTAFARGIDLDGALTRLIASGRVRRSNGGTPVVYSAREFVVPVDATTGWEAAVFDHFQAVVKTIGARLRADASTKEASEGGSTYSFEVWPGHPREAEVLGLLRDLRERTAALKKTVSAHNAAHARPERFTQVTFYGGQWILQQEASDAGEEE